MKTCMLFASLLISVPAFCQDVIVRHFNGNIDCKVTAVNENSISYTYPNETVTNSIGKAAVKEIQFESGRVESITEKVNINGSDGWENVIITSNPAEIVGLRRKGEVKSKAGGYWSMRTAKGTEKKATERIKKEAAELNAHVVFIENHESSLRSFYKNPESIQSGSAYGY